MRLGVSLALCLMLAGPVAAVQPDEILADAGLEARARSISALIRCPVCQGETIDDSNATIARDLRLVIRERLVAGDSDQAAIDYVVARYGEVILFRPRFGGANLVLWLAGPVMLGAGLGAVALYLRRRQRPVAAAALSKDEEARLAELLGERKS